MTTNEEKPQPFTMTYDASVDAAYIYNRDKQAHTNRVSKTVEVKQSNVYIDYDAEGKILGIEILNPAEVKLSDIFKLFGESRTK